MFFPHFCAKSTGPEESQFSMEGGVFQSLLLPKTKYVFALLLLRLGICTLVELELPSSIISLPGSSSSLFCLGPE